MPDKNDPALPDPYPIRPFPAPCRGSVALPGSKSITNRALILAALSRESLTIENALFSEDTGIMVAALQALGFTVRAEPEARSIFLVGRKGEIPATTAELHVGNAGTAARFLTAFLALKANGRFLLDGSKAMRKRPMAGLLDALQRARAVKATFQGQPGHFPFHLETHGLPAASIDVDASGSSQLLSALLMVAPAAHGPVNIALQGTTVSQPFVAMTLTMMGQFGVAAQGDTAAGPFSFEPAPYYYPRPAYVVEPDATAASYFLSLPWVTGGELRLRRLSGLVLQGDIAYSEVMEALGARLQDNGEDLDVSFPKRQQNGLERDFNAISDTFLTLAALAPLLDGPTTIRGIAHTRHQETDRISAMATELRKLGQRVNETNDSLTIHPDRVALKKATEAAPVGIDTYHDHRVAMSFGILGCYDLHGDGRPWLQIRNPACTAKTFPAFWRVLQNLRENAHA